jgi:hypothetical protein
MRYYGLKQVDGINLMRYEGVANQYITSLPMSYSNSVYKARADILYVCEGSGPITVTECQTNSDLVGFSYQPGTAYVPENVFGNNIVKLESGNAVPVLTMVTFRGQSNSYATDVATITVSGSYAIPPNTYAVVVEGTITVSNTTVDSNADLYILGIREEERTVEGNGKLITFKVV